LADIARGRPDLTVARVRQSWSEFRGRAVEPVVRQALERLAAADPRLGGAAHVGGYWTRTNDPEIDLVGVDRFPKARRTCFIGSIKWKDRTPFNKADLDALLALKGRMPLAHGAPTVVVSRAGVTARNVATAFGPAELLSAWT